MQRLVVHGGDVIGGAVDLLVGGRQAAQLRHGLVRDEVGVAAAAADVGLGVFGRVLRVLEAALARLHHLRRGVRVRVQVLKVLAGHGALLRVRHHRRGRGVPREGLSRSIQCCFGQSKMVGFCLPGRAVSWVRGFEKCFLRVHSCSAASLLPKQARGNLGKWFTQHRTQVTALPSSSPSARRKGMDKNVPSITEQRDSPINIEYRRPWLADSALMKTDSEVTGEAALCARSGLPLLAASIPHSSGLSNLTLLMRLSAAESAPPTALALLFTLDHLKSQIIISRVI